MQLVWIIAAVVYIIAMVRLGMQFGDRIRVEFFGFLCLAVAMVLFAVLMYLCSVNAPAFLSVAVFGLAAGFLSSGLGVFLG